MSRDYEGVVNGVTEGSKDGSNGEVEVITTKGFLRGPGDHSARSPLRWKHFYSRSERWHYMCRLAQPNKWLQ